jgi:ferredoxin--NADP+ reductase
MDIDTKRWNEGRVVELHTWTDTHYSLRVRADVDPFIAGQFTKIGHVIGDKLVSRPYSYVNSPDEELLEFYFVRVPDGPLTRRLIASTVGEAIWVMKRPSGFLTLNEVPDSRDLWLLSTGTAIGPFLSILKMGEVWRRFENVVLVHAVRFARELSYQDTIAQLAARHGGRFHYVPFVSREKTATAMPGRVTAALADASLEQRVGLTLDAAHSQVMVCGNPEMVKETTELLKQRGLEKNRRRTPGHITVENYW